MRPGREARIGRRRRLRVLLLALVGVGTAGLAVAAHALQLFGVLEADTVDARFAVRGPQRPPRNLVIVAVDTETFRTVGLRWPFPRAAYARVINRISAEHPAAIAVDVELSRASAPSDQATLLAAIRRARDETVFAAIRPRPGGQVRFLGATQGTRMLHSLGSRPGSPLFPSGSGGLIRRMDYSIRGLTTLALATAEVARRRPVPRRDLPGRSAWIDYLGPGGTVPEVPFSSAYGCRRCGTLPPDFFRGKVVVIGATAASLRDVHATPTDPLMTGPEVQANAIATALRGFPLRSVAGWVNIVLIVALAVAVPLVGLRAGPPVLVGAVAALAALLAMAAQLAFDSGRVIAFVDPLAALLAGAGGTLAVLLFAGLPTVPILAETLAPPQVLDGLSHTRGYGGD